MDLGMIIRVIVWAAAISSINTMRREKERGTDILRQNMGVVFEHLGKVRIGSNYWYHTFVVPLPLPIHMDSMWPEKRATFNYAETSTVFTDMLESTWKFGMEVRELAIDMFEPLPAPTSSAPRFRRTAPLAFVGPQSRSLFGTDTTDDIVKIANVVNQLSRMTKEMDDEVVVSMENMQSFMKTSCKRFNNLRQMISDNHDQLMILETAPMNDMATRFELERNLTLILAKQQFQLAELSLHMAKWKNAIMTLTLGGLPASLISKDMVLKAIAHLDEFNEAHGSNFTLMYQDVLDFFQTAKFIVHQQPKDDVLEIWVTLKIDVGQLEIFDLYRTHTWEVPAYNGSTHGTLIEQLPPFFAMSADGSGYVPATLAEMESCHGRTSLVCPFTQAITNISNIVCLAGLIRDDHKPCQVMPVHNAIMPMLRAVTKRHVLVQRLPSISIQCNENDQHERNGCDSCLISVPCECRIRSSGLFKYVSPTSPDCSEGGVSNIVLTMLSIWRYTAPF